MLLLTHIHTHSVLTSLASPIIITIPSFFTLINKKTQHFFSLTTPNNNNNNRKSTLSHSHFPCPSFRLLMFGCYHKTAHSKTLNRKNKNKNKNKKSVTYKVILHAIPNTHTHTHNNTQQHL